MKINNLQKDFMHRKICAKANYLHKVFAKIAPSTPNLKEEELGGRLKAFSKLVSLGKINFEDNSILDEFKGLSNIKSRSGKKKFMDSLIVLNLVSKDAKGVYSVTPEAERIWKSLNYLVEDNEQKFSIKEEISHFKYYYVKINTDGELYSDVFINTCYRNMDSKKIDYFNGFAFTDTPMYNFKLLEHSNNIDHYEIIEEQPTFKSFKLFLKKPLDKGDEVNIWYRYEWPSFFLNAWGIWDYLVCLPKPIKFLTIHITLPKEHMINEDSFSLNQSDLQKDSKKIGEFTNFEPIVLENSDNKEIIWKMENIPSNVTTKISWTHR